MYTIVADSCCDMTPALREELGVVSVPLTMTLGDESYTDDDVLDLPAFMDNMKSHKGRIGSAAPAPGLYSQAFERNTPSFGLTLSSRLSGSYQSAVAGAGLACVPGTETHVFDSKSASAGEILVAIKLRKLITEGHARNLLIEKTEQFISKMKTYFVLDNVDNLRKNGRLNSIVGKIISVLGIRPLMGSDGDGNISLFSSARGSEKAVKMMADTVASSGMDTTGQDMVITHCGNPGMAQRLKEMVEAKYRFGSIRIFPTRGLSSVYANDKGVIMAY